MKNVYKRLKHTNPKYRAIWDETVNLARKQKTPIEAIDWILSMIFPLGMEDNIEIAELEHKCFIAELKIDQLRLDRGDPDTLAILNKPTGLKLLEMALELDSKAHSLSKKQKLITEIKTLCEHDHSPELNDIWKQLWSRNISSVLPTEVLNANRHQSRKLYKQCLHKILSGDLERCICVSIHMDYDCAFELAIQKYERRRLRVQDESVQFNITMLSDAIMAAIHTHRIKYLTLLRVLYPTFKDYVADVHLIAAIDTSNPAIITFIIQNYSSTIDDYELVDRAVVQNRDMNAFQLLIDLGVPIRTEYVKNSEILAKPCLRQIWYHYIDSDPSSQMDDNACRNAYQQFLEGIDRISEEHEWKEFCRQLKGICTYLKPFGSSCSDENDLEHNLNSLSQRIRNGDILEINQFAIHHINHHTYFYVHKVKDTITIRKLYREHDGVYLPHCALDIIQGYNVQTMEDLNKLYLHIRELNGIEIYCADLDHRGLAMLENAKALEHKVNVINNLWVAVIKLGGLDDYHAKIYHNGSAISLYIKGDKTRPWISRKIKRIFVTP